MVDAPLPNTLGGRRLLLSGPGGRVSSFDAMLLGNSALARKLQAGADANAKLPDGAVAVHVHEEATFDALQTVASVPKSPSELRAWCSAADFVCADVEAPQFLQCVLSACRLCVATACDPHQGCMQDGSFVARLCSRGQLLTALQAGVAEVECAPDYTALLRAARDEASHVTGRGDSDAARASKRRRVENPGEAPPPTSPEDLVAGYDAAQHYLNAPQGREGTIWKRCREVLLCALLGLADTPAGARHIFADLRDMHARLGVGVGVAEGQRRTRWLVHRAVTALYAEEHRAGGAGASCLLGLGAARAVREAYMSGSVDLDCLVPAQRPCPVDLFVLQGLQREDRLAPDEGELRRRLCAAVPWLDRLWRACARDGFLVYVAGSLLTTCLRAGPLAEDPETAPSDVDLFVTDAGSLPRLAANAREAARALRPTVACDIDECSERKLRATFRGLEGAAGHADLYAHPLHRIRKYHMSLVRAAFDGTRLYCTPTACVALATSVSLDYEVHEENVFRPGRVVAILRKKWMAGAGLVVRRAELQLLRAHLCWQPLCRGDAWSRMVHAMFKWGEQFFEQCSLRLRPSMDANGDVQSLYARWRG